MNMQGAVRRMAAREWLLPLGDGGFAAGTVAGFPARSYHGLLVVVPDGGRERRLLAAWADEVAERDGVQVALSTGDHEPGALHPDGHTRIVAFRDTRAGPVWTFDLGGIRLERSIVVAAAGVRLQWRVLDGEGAALTVRPFLTDRSYHGGRDAVTGELTVEGTGRASWTSPEGRSVELATSGEVRPDEVRRALRHEIEAARGLGHVEDLVSPCAVDMVATRAAPAWLEITPPEPATIDGVELVRSVTGCSGTSATLREATAAFCIRDRATGRRGVLAGYPWFNEWGRDTMIAARGLAIAVGWDVVLEILDAWAQRCSRGMIPNRLAENESSDLYNSVDASLWMLVAVERAADSSPHPDRVLARFHDVAREIVEHYRTGTRHGIRVDEEDGLLTAGEGDVQLTWMDARIGDRPVTPRHGKCVEVNALYHAGLGLVERMERRAGHSNDAAVVARCRERLAASMARRFSSPDRPFIRDILDDEHDALRPNVVIALAAPRCPLPAPAALATLAMVRRELLTPVGLRTLAPGDRRYRGRCRGGVIERDEAYHQGTVWPWLMGPWADAELAHRGRLARSGVRRTVAAVTRNVLGRVVPGHVPEIFDGDAPHEARGAPAQAWSAAELSRAADI